jgi:hypothetical protein
MEYETSDNKQKKRCLVCYIFSNYSTKKVSHSILGEKTFWLG